MVLVDTSVWIDYFNGRSTRQVDILHSLLGERPLGIGDLILAETLGGFRLTSEYQTARELLLSLTVFDMLGVNRAIRSAELYRALRTRGITIRKTADVIIAAFCIDNGHELLHADRDFDPFVRYLDLSVLT